MTPWSGQTLCLQDPNRESLLVLAWKMRKVQAWVSRRHSENQPRHVVRWFQQVDDREREVSGHQRDHISLHSLVFEEASSHKRSNLGPSLKIGRRKSSATTLESNICRWNKNSRKLGENRVGDEVKDRHAGETALVIPDMEIGAAVLEVTKITTQHR